MKLPVALSRKCALIAFLVTVPASARADEIDRCLTAHPEAQRRRLDGDLRAAREQLLVCTQSACPRVVRAECGQWLVEVEALIPTVVISATTADHGDIFDVEVTMDGRPLVGRLDGKEVSVDPGPHVFRFERAGSAAVEEALVIREGEKVRRIAVSLPLEVAPPPPMEKAPLRPVPPVVYVLGGTAIVAGGLSAAFAIAAFSQEQGLRDQHCSPNCSRADTNAALTKYRIADVSLGVGLLALAGATYAYFTRRAAVTGGTSSVRLGAAPLARGASVAAAGEF